MLPDNLIVNFALNGITGFVWTFVLLELMWVVTDMDLSWHKVRRLTAELEEALRETREARDRAEEQIRFLAGEARLNKKPKKGGITWLNTDVELANLYKEKS